MAASDLNSPAPVRDACPSHHSSDDKRDGGTAGPMNLLVLLFHGHRAARRRVCLRDVHPSTTTASFLKEKVARSLREAPNECFLLAGDNVMFDSEVLSDYTVDGQTSVRAFVFYSKSTRWWQKASRPSGRIAEEAFPSDGSRPSEPEVRPKVREDERLAALAPNSSDSSAAGSEGIRFSWADLSSREAEILARPGVRRKTIPRALPWTGQETELVESGRAFGLAVHCRVVLVRRWHERVVSVPAASQTAVGEIEGRLAEWLGAAPDELVLTLEGQVLEACCKLEEYQIGPASALMALAWYKSAL